MINEKNLETHLEYYDEIGWVYVNQTEFVNFKGFGQRPIYKKLLVGAGCIGLTILLGPSISFAAEAALSVTKYIVPGTKIIPPVTNIFVRMINPVPSIVIQAVTNDPGPKILPYCSRKAGKQLIGVVEYTALRNEMHQLRQLQKILVRGGFFSMILPGIQATAAAANQINKARKYMGKMLPGKTPPPGGNENPGPVVAKPETTADGSILVPAGGLGAVLAVLFLFRDKKGGIKIPPLKLMKKKKSIWEKMFTFGHYENLIPVGIFVGTGTVILLLNRHYNTLDKQTKTQENLGLYTMITNLGENIFTHARSMMKDFTQNQGENWKLLWRQQEVDANRNEKTETKNTQLEKVVETMVERNARLQVSEGNKAQSLEHCSIDLTNTKKDVAQCNAVVNNYHQGYVEILAHPHTAAPIAKHLLRNPLDPVPVLPTLSGEQSIYNPPGFSGQKALPGGIPAITPTPNYLDKSKTVDEVRSETELLLKKAADVFTSPAEKYGKSNLSWDIEQISNSKELETISKEFETPAKNPVKIHTGKTTVDVSKLSQQLLEEEMVFFNPYNPQQSFNGNQITNKNTND